MTEICAELKKAKPEDILEATIWGYKIYTDMPQEAEKFMRLGFKIAQKDGWKECAPLWLREYRKCKRI